MNRRSSFGRTRIAGLSSLALGAACLAPPVPAGLEQPIPRIPGRVLGRRCKLWRRQLGELQVRGGQNDVDGGGPAVPPPGRRRQIVGWRANRARPIHPRHRSPSRITSCLRRLRRATWTPQSAPQIVVIGWDDVESTAGVDFITSLLGSLQNPAANPNSHLTAVTANLNANACYSNSPAAGGGMEGYACGDGSLASGYQRRYLS